MAGNPFDFLKTTNDWLETVPIRVINAFNNFIGDGEKIAQEKVDTICAWLAWKVNIQIERVRQGVIKALYNMYKTTVGGRVMSVAMAIKDFFSDPLGAVGSFASAIFSPVSNVISWYSALTKEIPRLAQNLSKVASALPPTPPNPHISYDKFKLKIKSISLSTITSDPSKLPSPESMFPEPEKPFSKDTFEDTFLNTSAKLKSNKLIYKLNDKQKQSLNVLANTDLVDMSELDNMTFDS